MDDGHYLGLVTIDDLRAVPRTEWATTPVASILHDDAPHASPSWTIERAIRAMDRSGQDLLPVTDGAGPFVGVVTTADLLRLDAILESSPTVDPHDEQRS